MKGTLAVNNELIRRRRRRNAIKRTIATLVLLIAVLVTLCLKLSYFNLENIKVLSNKVVSTEDIITSCQLNKGTNIFYINTKKIRTNILSNPYILDAYVKRVLPNTISIAVKERSAVFFVESNGKYIIVDKNGIVLEIRDNIDNMQLTKLLGFNADNIKLGNVIPYNSKTQIDDIALMTELITMNSSGIAINSVNLSESSAVEVTCGNMTIKLGTSDFKDKLNKALNLIIQNNYKDSKGYIDFSVVSNPTVYIEK